MSERMDLPPVTEGITYDPESGTLLSYDKSIQKYDVFRLPEGVKVIPKDFFKEKLFATKLILPSTLKVVSSGAFERTLIEEIEFLDGEGKGHALKIEYFAFERINNLRRVRLPKHVCWIWGHAFAYCQYLKKVTIGSNVKRVEKGAFYESPVKDVYVKALTPPTVSSYLFSKNPTIHVPSQALAAYQASEWAKYGTIVGDLESVLP